MHVVRKVVRKGSEHETYCEDSIFHFEDDGFVCIAAFDGCSGGYHSHFASELMAKLFRKHIKRVLKYRMLDAPIVLSDIGEKIIRDVFLGLLVTKSDLELNEFEILSTVVFAIIDTRKNDAYCIISGDGMIFVNGHPYEKVSKDNMPDYMAYYLNGEKPGFLGSLMKFHVEDVKDLSVCSDGIGTFLRGDGTRVENSIIYEKLLTGDFLQKSEAMLARRINLIEKNEGFMHFDDISIVRYININNGTV